ncbi:two-component sensor histidine kinase [Desulfonema ishimotonii]|uniref:histidine kinase n=1 Tax=Desulfonema ishimotonii TaxID=45657 RepID=A0A401FZD8_9BACT|nr:PAS domain-containing sensor histidine kinase [Desulfonema ishimotonii]GBC62293.1 two-component sensor histidine kinase [Desulfonema ishimotonii]
MSRNENHTPRYYQTLTRRMVLILIVVSFTPMILVSGFILNQFRVSYQEKIYAHLGELVLKHKHNIDLFLREKLSDIRFVADVYSLQELSSEDTLREKLTSLRREYGTVFEDLGVISAGGLQIAYAGPFKLEHADYSDAEWFREALNNPYFVSDVFPGLRGKPHFIVSVRNIREGTPWILRATIDFLAFNSLVENLRIGQTGFAFILDRDGNFQTRPFFASAENNAKRLYNFLKNGKKMPSGVHIAERKDESGQTHIYVGAFLKEEEWLLIYRQNQTDAFADLVHAQKIAILLLAMGGLCIVITAILISRRMVGRITVADREKEMMNRQVIETGKLASVGELAAGIAHEINNPVAIMVEEAGWIGDLLEEEDLKQCKNLEEFYRALKQIHTQGKRCKEITHKLLSFARKTDTRIQDVALNTLIEEMVSLSAQQAKYSNVNITTHLRPDIPTLRLSQTELQQVLLNLINNALYAMDGTGGTIDITSRREDAHIVIGVADTGSGIPRANLSRIFDPFFTTKPVGKGSGLGLSICYGIIKKMGGDIDVTSVMGEGTTFSIWLPVTAGSPPEGTADRDGQLSQA